MRHAIAVGLLLAACGGHPNGQGYNPGTGQNHYDVPSPNGSDGPCSLGQFGACVPEAQCGPSEGHLSSVACSDPAAVCCAPLDRCTGSESFVCCDAQGNEHRPVCDASAGSASTALGCPYDQVEAMPGQCASAEGGGACTPKGNVCDPSNPTCCSGSMCAPAQVPTDGGPPTPPECI